MDKCCVDTLQTIQDRIETSKWLKIALVASPFVLLFDGTPPPEAAGKMLQDMAIGNAVEKMTKSKSPEVADAVLSIDPILRNRIKQDATLHYLKHNGSGPAGRFWAQWEAIYR
jgi:hypothetical protein